WHFYASGPSKTNPRKKWTTGTPAEKKLITDAIQSALAWQKKTQIPTWVGAWMSGNYNDGNHFSPLEQSRFAAFMRSELDKAKIPFAVNSDTKFYDREKNVWISEMRLVWKAIFGVDI
ncbi:MAG: glycosyl hydrolase family 5, partial [Bacilli bacterium]